MIPMHLIVSNHKLQNVAAQSTLTKSPNVGIDAGETNNHAGQE